MPVIIKSKKFLGVEGKDEKNFFDAFLEYNKISDVQVEEVGGVDKFKDKLPALIITPGFSDVEILAIIRDADSNAKAAFQSIKNILTRNGLSAPTKPNHFSKGKPKIGIYVLPNNSDSGMLEDLCLKSVQQHPAMECVNAFSDCIEQLDDPPNRSSLSKAKAQAFLAAMPDIVNSVGLGAKKKFWSFDSQELSDLRNFLKHF